MRQVERSRVVGSFIFITSSYDHFLLVLTEIRFPKNYPFFLSFSYSYSLLINYYFSFTSTSTTGRAYTFFIPHIPSYSYFPPNRHTHHPLWQLFFSSCSFLNFFKPPMDDSSGNWNWLFDYSTMEDLPVVGAHFSPPQSVSFSWSNPSINFPSNKHSLEVDCSYEDLDSLKEVGRKRLKAETSSASTSKACREKLRRDKLNERFLELSAVLEPGKLPKTDKVAILSDAIRMVTDLQCEIEKLRESEDDLKEKIKELKVEKNELRDEKQRLRAEKEKLELQIKAVNARAAADIQHPPPTLSAAFTAQGQTAGNKLMPFIGYPSIAMWQFLPPATVDTSQDHVLRPPVA